MVADRVLYRVCAEATRQAAGILETVLDEGEATVWIDADRDLARIEYFVANAVEAEAVAERLRARAALLLPGAALRVAVAPLPDRDWQEAWKEHFRTERVSPRIVIRPPWEPFAPGPGDCVIALEPGMSFGTGQHATTRACLRYLDARLAERGGASFLDIGCGSGILSIAAARLGCRDVAAIDNDPLAVDIARENARRNGAGDAIAFAVEDLTRWRAARRYDIVAANILADVLCACRDAVAGAVADGGCLLLAGILLTQMDGVRAVYAEAGFHADDLATEGEWTSGRFSRRAARAGAGT